MPMPSRIKINRYKAPPPRKREGDSRDHLDFIKSLPCLVCGSRHNVDPHHLLKADDLPKGMGRRNLDRYAIPLCRRDHDALHAKGDEAAYFASKQIDYRSIPGFLWAISGDQEQGERIIRRSIEAARLKIGVFI